jgi:hypothetical protein
MFRIFNKENKVDIVLDGEISITTPSLLSYEEYKKKEIRSQLKEQVIKKLDEICPAYQVFAPTSASYFKDILASYLVDKELK